MNYTPLFINLKNRKVLFVGGGTIATAKARYYKSSKAKLVCISPTITEKMLSMASSVHQREVTIEDIDSKYFLIVIATNQEKLNASLAKICKEKNILHCNCSAGLDSDVIHGAIFREGGITVATNSLGVPAVSAYIKSRLKEIITPKLVAHTQVLRTLRKLTKNKFENTKKPLKTRKFKFNVRKPLCLKQDLEK